MRLTHIKLAGFKSFVDPTNIPVPGQLVAVCGPNGCGKSNVIDAVRWVLGESSAKQLRGESMQDVIFNGSTARKSVGRASVELVFDNTAGLAAGQWAQYAEIAIKRVLTRQGDASYYINGLQVRRRDITDLFLGTGVGKGGYAIIEQGMISRIIEARPEELRLYLEEAAGVSKYKERRRETESRLADTRINLERLDDVRSELESQLSKLETQAEVASEYNRLKEAIIERQNLLALARKLDAALESEAIKQQIHGAQNAYESQLADLRAHEASIEILREAHYTASDAVHAAQGELYDANANVARLEQQLLHLRQTRERLTQQLAEVRTELAQLQRNDQQLHSEQSDWLARKESAVLTSEEAALALEEESLRLPDLEMVLREADVAFQAARDRLSKSRSSVQLADQQLQHHERTLVGLKSRHERLQADHERLSSDHDPDLAGLLLLQDELQEQEETLAQQVSDLESGLGQLRENLLNAQSERERLALEQTSLQARASALADLLATQDDAALNEWLAEEGLAAAPRVFELLDVASGWETALEAALGVRLQARLAAAQPLIAAPAQVALVLAGGAEVTPAGALQNLAPLLQYVSSSSPTVAAALQDWLAQVWCVEDEADLAVYSLMLPPGGWLVTPSGHVASRHSVHYHAGGGVLAGLVARRKELGQLHERLAQCEPTLVEAVNRVRELQQQLQDLDLALKDSRQQLQAVRQRRASDERELARRQEAAEQARRRRSELAEELQATQQQIEDEMAGLLQCEQALQDTQADTAPLAAAQEEARLARAQAEADCEAQREQLRQAERRAQEARFAVQTATARLQGLQQRTEEFSQREAHLTERMETLALELDGVDESQFDSSFQEAVNLRADKELGLAQARDQLNGTQQQLRDQEAEKQRIEVALDPAREAVNALRLKEQEARLAVERFQQELDEAGADEAALRPLLKPGTKISALVGEIGRLSQALNGLGAVNLAALQELEAARERQHYLDAQSTDLLAAVETLENAIRRIDKETRNLLQNTFDMVNASLQELFPSLFGGGHAELILTGEEILDAGVQIMAQPPGKKNSTIHLLSGGEKALTALSLVFSLFQLNPAPFCILDEVDAPLDDANTLRFCELVKKMAQRTQFLYISHNRLTMEMAEQLVGVTMQEQGVSRIVAVDIEQALSMREVVPA